VRPGNATIWSDGAGANEQLRVFGNKQVGLGSMEKKTRFVVKSREAIGDNGARVLNIDGAEPGRIYAYIDEDVLREMNVQLARRADTSDVVVPHREGRAVECVTYNSTLREMLTAGTTHFSHDDQIDSWIAEFESLAQYLREFKVQRRQEARGIFCKHCLHCLLDHERPDSGELNCQHQDCDCRGFFPIEPQKLN
jgi:hypothetical protein